MSPLDIQAKSKTPALMQQYEESKENMSAAESAFILAQKRSKTPQQLPLQTYTSGGIKVELESDKFDK